MRGLSALIVSLSLTAAAMAGGALPPPMSIDQLREADFDVTLVRERDLDGGTDFTAHLVSYEHSGLRLYAMIAVPTSQPPASGFPIVIANHGYVPEPRKYGITRDGIDARPGEYYRSVPQLFTSRGFLTVIPDYRGHNSSEGFEFIDPQDDFSVEYYAEDVVALMSALDQLERADTDNVFMWAHSMGGRVSLRALLATDIVRAVSFWSTMNLDDLMDDIGKLDLRINVHHNEGDEVTPVTNSDSLAAALEEAGLLARFRRYPESPHFFEEERRAFAADQDAELFRSTMQ